MTTALKNVLASRVSSLWFALACLLLVGVLAVARFMVNDIEGITDRWMANNTQPAPVSEIQ